MLCEASVSIRRKQLQTHSLGPRENPPPDSTSFDSTLDILLIDRCAVHRLGLRIMLESYEGLAIIAEATDGLEGLELAKSALPDIIVTEQFTKHLCIKSLIRSLSAAKLKSALLTFSDDAAFHCVSSAGVAVGYLPLTAEAPEIVRAIHTLARLAADSTPAEQAALPRKRRAAPTDPLPLSKREEDVLRLVARELTMKEIANQLGLSPRTLETYKARGAKKLGLKNRAELTRHAEQNGWFSPDVS